MRFLLAVTALLLVAAGLLAATNPWASDRPSAAELARDFDSEQQAQIKALLREALLENPEIIPEAIAELQAREARSILSSYRSEIETPFPGAEAGNPDGDITLVEFFDFRCPFCQQANDDLARLLEDDANLRVVFKDMPVLDRGEEQISRQAALAALAAARQGQYDTLRSAIYALPGQLTQERLIEAIRSVDVDEARIASDMKDAALSAVLDGNIELARNLGISGTPSYVIGDEVIQGAVGLRELKDAIARQRARNGQS